MTAAGGDRSLALMKRALEEIRELRTRLHAQERAAHEPIAIVGMGCRFPGRVMDPDALWRFFLAGGDAIRDVPAERRSLQPADGDRRRFGSFLDDIDRFDAPFFEISAREARSMDPQQRLLLEVSWETLERAGVRPSALRGSRTGVYVGVMTAEYEELTRDERDIDLHTATGNAPSVIAGRLSHFYGFQGPALIVDTACSSSLASVHLACQALRRGECDQALAGGVNLMLSSRAYEAESRAGMLAADGRCKTFDARADGIGRGEGAALVFLKRLSDALAAGDPIVAVIRGSAMNHDGRSSGLTTPNERAQERVLLDALADAHTTPGEIGFVEAHGTGTSLGDPVEVGALATVFGDRSNDPPLLVGAAKANFGHLEGAAGILALMKAALIVSHGEVPPQLHVEQPNPLIPWSRIPIAIPVSRQPYPAGDGDRAAGVSSFGLSGTNVHLVVAQPPRANPLTPLMIDERRASRPAHLLAFSARTPEALDAMDARLRAAVASLPGRAGDLGHTIHTTREAFEHRRAVVFADGASEPAFVVSGVAARAPRVAFAFPGESVEWQRAGEQLLHDQPHFRDAVARALDHVPQSFADVDDRVSRFVVSYALAEMWRAWGIEPSALAATGEGAWVAACVAGSITPQDAIRQLSATPHAAMPPPAAPLGHDVLVTCGPGGDEWDQILRSAAELYVHGAPLDREQMDAGLACAHVAAPTYAFEDRRYWVEERPRRTPAGALRLVRKPVAIAGPHRIVFEAPLDPKSAVRDHRIHGAVVLPAAAFVDLGLQIARDVQGKDALGIANLSIVRPLILDETDADVTLQAVADTSGSRVTWQLFRLEAGEWTLHAEGEIATPSVPVARARIETLQAAHAEPVDVPAFYESCAAHGLNYGPAYRSLAGVWRGAGSVLARIETPGPALDQLADPAALDGCLQMLGALFAAESRQTPLLPAAIETFSLACPLPATFWCVATPRPHAAEDSSARVVDLDLFDDSGSTLAVARGVTLRQPAAFNVQRDVPLRTPIWEPLVSASAAAASLRGTWLIAGHASEGAALAARLRAEGAHCAIVGHDDDCARVIDGVPGPLRGVVHLCSGEGEDALVSCASLLRLVQALADRPRAEGFRLQIVTRGAQVVRPGDGPVDPWQAPVWGLARVALLEHPELRCRLFDLDPAAAVDDIVDAVIEELGAQDGDEQVARRSGRRYGLRLVDVPVVDPQPMPRIDSERSYLITGGLGALGLQVAGWLVSRGAKHLTLTGRSAAGPAALAAIDALRARGAVVRVVRGDVAIEADAVRAVREAATDAPLGGIVHAAGVLDDRALARTTWESCARVFAPKIHGAWNLHRATRDAGLDFFVLFSSAASILGSPGQANYAAANAWMDALAHHRARLGLPALSINWGPWAGAGMAAGATAEYLTPLSTRTALDALERSFASGRAQVAVLSFTPRFFAEFGSAAAPRLIAELARWRPVESVIAAPPITVRNARAEIDAAPAAARRSLLTSVVHRIVDEVLGRSVSSGAPAAADVSLVHAGMDSLMALEIRDRVRSELDVTLPVVDILASPSIGALVDRIDASVAPAPAAVPGVGEAETWPVTHGQRSLWFLHGLDPASCAYHVAFVARVRSPIDVPALGESFSVLARRHPVLVARFGFEGGELVCRTRPDQRVVFDVIDLSGASEWDDAALAQRVRAEYARPFDLAAGDAPFRVALISRSPNDHVLLTTAHHIVYDAWSMWVMAEELRDVYSALRTGGAPQLPPATRPFSEFAREERARLAGPETNRLWEFWRGELAEPLPLLELPADHSRPARRTSAGATHTFELTPPVTAALRQFAAREGVTLFTLLLAGFQSLLHRYSAQDDLIVGTPMSGRDTPGFERTVGYFVNPVPVRSRVTAATTFRELLTETRGRVFGAMAHQGLPFSLLVDKLQPAHDPSRTPVFQALFVFQQPQEALELSALHSASGAADWGGLRLEPYELHQQEGQFDLTLELVDHGERIAGAWKYSRDLFERETAERMLAHLRNLLTAAVVDPDAPLQQLDLLSAGERDTIVSAWNATAQPYDLETTLIALLKEQAARTPDAIAVVAQEGALSYAALDAEASRLAAALRARGIEPGGAVGVYADRSLALMVALCGILKAGCAYVPLDPEYPAERLAYMAATAGVRLVLTQTRLQSQAAALGVVHLPLDGPGAYAWRVTPPAAPVAVSPDALAYVLFTSGSTGRPKGVMVSHRAIVNRLLWMQETYRLTSGDVVLQKTPASFDVSVWEFFWPLLTGATLVMARPGGHRDPTYLADVIRAERVTTLHFVPSMLAAFVEEPTVGTCGSLRDVICSGEALPAPLCARFFARSAAALHNLYGPTEAAVDVTSWPVARDAQGPVPIGRPIANIRLHVLDQDGQPCPIGVPGELLIGGVGLARGYAGRPALTAERFVPDPLNVAPGARLYRTGDRSRYRADGAIEYLGRLDFQVKLRGQRIELGEIERTLAAHSAVRAAAVVLSGEGSARARLIAHVEFHSAETAATEDELRAHLARQLPDVMVPARIVAHDALPLTTSGKIDRRRLPEPPADEEARDSAPARNAVEASLAAIWAEMLGRQAVGIHDNFFALGGDSILGMQMVMRAARAGIHVTVAQFYENQTVAALARAAGAAPALDSEREPADTWTPPTPIQAWFFERDLKAPHYFNQSVMFEIADGLDDRRLEQAVRWLLEHHDALRRAFSPAGESRAVALASEPPFVRVNLSAVAESDRRAALEAHARKMQGALDPSTGVLFNVTRYTLGHGHADRLHFIAHHLAVDGVSWRILLDDLRATYRALEQGDAPLLPKTASYARWSERLRQYAGSESVRAETGYWLRQSEPDAAPLFPAGTSDGEHAAPRTLWLDASTTASLLGRANDAYRTRTDDLLVTAMMQAIGDWGRCRTACVDLESHGRSLPLEGVDASRTVGWFTALYPVRLDLGSRSDPGAELASIKEALRAVPHQGIGYGVLRYLSDAETRARLATRPPSDVRFNYLGRLDQGLTGDFLLRIAGEDGGPLHAPGERADYALDVNAYVLDGRFCMRWTHDPNRVGSGVAHAIADHVLDRLRALIAHCEAQASPRLTPSDVPAARLDQDQLDRFLATLASNGIAAADVADICELSPVQEGMLYHSLTAETGSIYSQRMSVVLRGRLRVADFRAAWQSVLDRHPALRTAFIWDDVAKPLQVVLNSRPLPWEEEDWRHKTPEQQRLDLDARVAVEAQRGFDLTRAPLMRCLLVRLADDAVYFAWHHHHILLDGWSFGQILHEVMARYNQPDAPAISHAGRYRDYIGWLQSRPLAAGQRFWRDLLDGFTSPTELGIERPVPDRAIAIAHRETVREIDAASTEALARAARDANATLGVFIQAAWAALLHRYSGADDVVFGMTVAGRPAELRDVDRTVGLFINTLPVRARVPGRRIVRDLLSDLMAQQAAREAYTSSSLAEIQSATGIPAGVPLFRSVVVLENYPLEIDAGNPMPGVELVDFQFAEQTNYPLTLVVFPGERLRVKLSYDAQRFTADGVAAMLNHFVELLGGMAGDAGRAIDAISLLSAGEKRHLVEVLAAGHGMQFPARAMASRSHASLHAMVEAWAARTPDAAALSWIDGGAAASMSYGELERRSTRLARRLRAVGVKRGDRVGVLMERSPSLIVALLGILKAGAAYVPCDPAYPDARVQFMLDDTQAVVTLCDEHLRVKLSASSSTQVLSADAAVESPEDGDAPLSLPCSAGDPAYVIYTSGSTGKPKGVIVTHGNVMRLFDRTDGWFAFAPEDVWTFFHSVAFDFSVWEIWGALVHGARVSIVPFDVSRSTDLFHRLLVEDGVTVLSQTPSAFSQLMLVDQTAPAAPADQAAPAALALRYVVFGGEALDIRKLAPWFDRRGDAAPRLINMYGITETTVHVTYRPLTALDATRAESVVGVPIPDLTLYVLDGAMETAPVGVPGEMYVGGAGLALGYLGRPALTAERFVPDPYGGVPGNRLYKTGDRGRFLADGDAEHLGRIDAQVKLRGFRIELGEIEAALRASSGVADAVAVLADLPSGPGLVGYVVADRSQGSGPLDLDSLRASLHGRLPEYMVPAALVALDEMPRTSNGKLDRRALPAPAAVARPRERVVPRTEAERRVLDIWRDVLPMADIGIHDNFFDLGGHSLLLVRVHSRLKAEFGRDFPIVTLFAHPTIHTLARFLGDPDETMLVEAAAMAGRDRGVERGARQDARSRQRAARERSRRPGVASE